LVIGRSREGDAEQLAEEVKNTGLNLFGEVPNDPLVAEYDLKGKALLSLPEDSAAVQATHDLFKRLEL
jgi:CO dehydrogenase maturation factor